LSIIKDFINWLNSTKLLFQREEIEKLNALNRRYRSTLTRRDWFINLFLAPIIIAGLVLVLTFNPIYTIVEFVVIIVYARRFIMPEVVMHNYRVEEEKACNKFVGSLTQIMMDKNKNIITSLERANERISGELQAELAPLILKIKLGSENSLIKAEFARIYEKYKNDHVFVQFMEQIETWVIDGEINRNVLKNIKTYHDLMYEKRAQFYAKKREHFRDIRSMIFVIGVFITLLITSFSFNTYRLAFVDSTIGTVLSVVYVTVVLLIMDGFRKNYFDDNIISLKRGGLE
jgi:hypothetical protein